MAATFITINLTEPDYITLLDYERNFDITYWRRTWSEFWVVSVYLSAVYLIFLFGGVFYMKSRKPFKIKGLLIIWNIGLSVMSILAFIRCMPEFSHVLSGENGFHHSICEWKEHNPASAFWIFVMLLSKLVEFGDTAFIVLRKKNLLFLHYYHHVVTFISCWYMYSWYEPIQLWYLMMNAFVHSFMYAYYTLRAMNIKIPKMIAMFITSLQLLQMFIGVFLNVYSLWVMYINGTPDNCPHRSWIGLTIALSIYSTFVFLFAKFFITSYIVKPKEKKKI